MFDRPYVSPTPSTARGGYSGPLQGYLIRNGTEVWLRVDTQQGHQHYPPGSYQIAQAHGVSNLPLPGEFDANGKFSTLPDPVVVDFIGGYAGKPVVLIGVRLLDTEHLTNADLTPRRAVEFTDPASDKSFVRMSALDDTHGTLTVTAGESVTIEAGDSLTLSSPEQESTVVVTPDDITLKSGTNEARGIARIEDTTTSDITTDSSFWTWIAAAGTALAGIGVTLPAPTSLTGKISSASSRIKAGG